MEISKKVASALVAAAFLGAASAPIALAGAPGTKCNAGRGNGSETEPSNDCDPGNSGGHNNGGD